MFQTKSYFDNKLQLLVPNGSKVKKLRNKKMIASSSFTATSTAKLLHSSSATRNSNPFLGFTHKTPTKQSSSPPRRVLHLVLTASISRSSPPAAPPPSQPKTSMASETVPSPSMKLLFVEMGVGYDQHGYFLFFFNPLTTFLFRYSIFFDI